jgi:hypothetical protein
VPDELYWGQIESAWCCVPVLSLLEVAGQMAVSALDPRTSNGCRRLAGLSEGAREGFFGRKTEPSKLCQPEINLEVVGPRTHDAANGTS